MSLPTDPIILLSYLNTQLRDGCPSLEELCRRENADPAALEKAMEAIGYQYDQGLNKFV